MPRKRGREALARRSGIVAECEERLILFNYLLIMPFVKYIWSARCCLNKITNRNTCVYNSSHTEHGIGETIACIVPDHATRFDYILISPSTFFSSPTPAVVTLPTTMLAAPLAVDAFESKKAKRSFRIALHASWKP
mmetsp:Transcript_69573/g.141470  ORF Transcript_69573/g.141470 Transcript_69573/m.141470 type:complete len:136 (-) Transcript_69573:5-412(-)